MATHATDEIDKMTEIWVKLFHPRNPSRLLGPGCLKRLGKCEKKGSRPSPRASEISPLRIGPERWRATHRGVANSGSD